MITRLFLAIVVAFGFATMAFANGGGGGGGDVIYPQDPNFPKDEFMRNCGAKDVKCTGAVYRCFKYLGKSQNTNAKNKQGYCLPKPGVYCQDGGKDGVYEWKYNQKEWEWSYNLGYKKDKDGNVIEQGTLDDAKEHKSNIDNLISKVNDAKELQNKKETKTEVAEDYVGDNMKKLHRA